MRLMFGLLLLVVAAVYVSDVGGARQPMADAYFGAVRWALQPVLDRFEENIAPSPSPTPSAAPTPSP